VPKGAGDLLRRASPTRLSHCAPKPRSAQRALHGN